MRNGFTFNFFSKLVVVLFLLALIPFLILSFYAEPSGDDYSYAIKMLDKSFIETQIGEYMNWGSRYTATAVLILNPISFGWFGGYKVISAFMILSFVLSSFYFFSTFLKDKKIALLVTSMFVFLYLFLLPDITSGFYWLAGSVTYHFANVLSLLFLAFVYRASVTNKIIYKLLCFLLVFLIIGCNEVSMVYLDVFLFVMLLYAYFKTKKLSYFNLGLIVFAGILTLFILLAPGNRMRAESIEPHNLSILSMMGMILKKLIVVLFRYGLMIFCVNFLVFYNLRFYFKELHLNFLRLPTIFYIFLFGIFLFLGNFASVFSMGIYPPLRTVNVMFLVILIFSMIINYKLVTTKYVQELKITQPILSSSLIVLVFFYVFSLRDKDVCNQPNNLYFAYKDLLDGTASRYSEETKNRRNFIEKSTEEVVHVDPIKNYSRIITYSDLLDPDYFYNVALAKFYNKRAIVVKTNK